MNNITIDNTTINILDKYSIGEQRIGTDLKEIYDKSKNRELIIPVLGMQGMGKSTLINAILKEDIMPSEADETTCVPVEIKYGENEHADVFFIDRNRKEIIHRKDELQKYVDNNYNNGNEKQISRIVLYRKNELLKKGLTLVDLPGVGSLTKVNEETTKRYIQNLCTAIFVIPTVPTIRNMEAMFIQSVWTTFPMAIFVQNRWVDETQQAIEESVSYNTMRIKQIAEKINTSFDEHIIVVNAYDAIAGAINNNEKKVRESNISELLDKISCFTDDWEKITNKLIVERYFKSLLFVENRIKEKIEDVNKSVNELEKQKEEKLHQFDAQTAELENTISEARTYLRKKENDTYDYISQKAKEYAGNVRAEVFRKIDSGIVDGEKLTKVFNDVQENYAEALSGQILELTITIKTDLEKIFYNICEKITTKDSIDFYATSFNRESSIKFEKGLNVIIDIAGAVGGAAAGYSITAALAAAGTVAGPLGTAIGFLAGIAIAGIASLIGRKTKKAILEKRAENAKNEIEKYIKASERSFKESVNKNFDQFFESAYKAFKEIIENRQSERNNLLADFNTTSVMDKTELENDLQSVEQRKNDIRNV